MATDPAHIRRGIRGAGALNGNATSTPGRKRTRVPPWPGGCAVGVVGGVRAHGTGCSGHDTWDRMVQQGIQVLERGAQDGRVRIGRRRFPESRQ